MGFDPDKYLQGKKKPEGEVAVAGGSVGTVAGTNPAENGGAITALVGEVRAFGPGSATAVVDNAAVLGKVLAGYTPVAGTLQPTDTILQAFQKLGATIGAGITALIGEATANGPGIASITLDNDAVTGKVLTGFVAAPGTVAATDSILQAIQKLTGNQSQFQPTGNYITALSGDVTAAGPGSAAATVQSVGGASAASVAAATAIANAATASNTPSAVVRRDSSGNFAAGTITANLLGNASTATTATTATNFTGSLAGEVVGTQGATTLVNSAVTGKLLIGFSASPGTVSSSDSILVAIGKLAGNQGSFQPSGNYITALTGDVSASGPGSSAATVNSVGGASAASIASAVSTVGAATASGTPNTIVRRDGSGNFSANIITATLVGNATNVNGVVTIAHGGTGATTATGAFNALSPMTTLGDIIYGDAAGAGTRLPGHTGASKRFLTQTGDGSNSAAPAWAAIAPSDVPDISATYLARAGGSMLGALSMGGFRITNVLDPVGDQDAATKSYVDQLAQGLSWKDVARAATTGPLPSYTYLNGVITATSIGALPAQDGVTLTTNDRLVVKDESGPNAPFNGIYVVTQVGNGIALPFILTRSADANTANELEWATIQLSAEGATQGGFLYRVSSPISSLGVDDVDFSLISQGLNYNFTGGLQQVGSTVSALIDGTSIQLDGFGRLSAPNSSYITSLTGEATATGPGAAAVTLSNAAVIAKVLTGFVSGPGSITAADSILEAIEKLDGNVALKQNQLTFGDLTSPTSGVSVTGGTGAVIGSGAALSIDTASGSQPGLLSAADWNTFNAKQSALSFGNLTGTNVSVTGGTGAVIGAGVNVSIPQSVAAAASPTFAGMTLTGFAGVVKAALGVLSAALIVDADVGASAGINLTKLAAMATDKLVVSDPSTGFMVPSTGTGIVKVSSGTPTYAATINIGTETAGTLDINRGGTNATTKTAAFNNLSPMTTVGDMIYGGAAGTGTRLPGNTTTTRQFLISQGNGTVASAPQWGSIQAGDVPALAYVTSVGLSLPAIFSVSGSPVTSSGTLTATLANQAANTVFAGPTSGGAAAPGFRALVASDIPVLPYLSSALPQAQIYVGNNSGVAHAVPMSGDVLLSDAGLATIPANTVTNAKLAQMAAGTLKGNNTGGASDPLDLTATQVTAMLNAMVGDSGTGGTKGLVPAPGAGDAAAIRYLRADATWVNPLFGLDSAAADSVAAGTVAIRGGNKTAGTGNGGAATVSGGTSAGGVGGSVTISGGNAVGGTSNGGNATLAGGTSVGGTAGSVILATAGIARLTIDGAGVLTLAQPLSKVNGGSGQDNTNLTFPSTGTLATIAGAEVFTNKDIDGGTAANNRRITIPQSTLTSLNALTRKEGTLWYANDVDRLYVDDGTTLKAVGAGSGSINYITNPDAEGSTADWTAYANTPGVAPVTGTGGSPTTTWTRSTSSPLVDLASFVLTKGAADRQGDGASTPFTIAAADQGKQIAVTFVYQTDTNFATGDVKLYVIDVTNATVTQLSQLDLVKSDTVAGAYTGTFQSATNSTSYRLCLHVATTNSSAYTVKVDRVTAAPQNVVYAAVVTDWQDYTPSVSGLGTGSGTASGKWRRVGDSIEISAGFTKDGSAGTGASTVVFGLPSGINVDTSKRPSTATTETGYFMSNNVSTSGQWDIVGAYYNSGSNGVSFVLANGAGGGSATGSSFRANSISSFRIMLPVLGWGSNLAVGSYDGRTVAVRYTGTSMSGSFTAANDLVYNNRVVDTHNCYSSGTFTAPVQGYYRVSGNLAISATTTTNSSTLELLVYKNGSLFGVLSVTTAFLTTAGYTLRTPAAGSLLVPMNAGETLSLRCNTTGTISAQAFNNNANTNSIDIELVPGRSTPVVGDFYPPNVIRYTSGSGTYVPSVNARYIRVTIQGGGGGGGGSGTGGGGGGDGGDTTFGTRTAGGGNGGANLSAGSGGSVIGSGYTLISATAGARGDNGQINPTTANGSQLTGGQGGSSPFGGAGSGGGAGGGGQAAATNSGSGGGGGGNDNTGAQRSGGGGGSGAYQEFIVYPVGPGSSFSYSVGAAGTAGPAGTGGIRPGGAGAAGIIIIEEYF